MVKDKTTVLSMQRNISLIEQVLIILDAFIFLKFTVVKFKCVEVYSLCFLQEVVTQGLFIFSMNLDTGNPV